ncbi:MAG TPA: hypothetical protein VNQ77_12495 [Frankiaceae bacterium]|nr:hypothetical protein [Frankiaceae bacterium]
MPSRRLTFRLLLAVCALLVVLHYAGGVSWGLRAAGGLLIATFVIRWGLASMRPLQLGTKTYDPVDVVEDSGVPVYSCKECGTQLVLLRRGSDKAPRHCGEAMTYAIVPETDTVPDYVPEDL